MRGTELNNLRRARSRCHLKLKQAEAIVARYQAHLADLQARIQAIAPDLGLPPRFYKPNQIFARGELPRVALAILREAGTPLPIRVIAVRALARKECQAPTRRIFKMTRVRLQQLFRRLDAKGLTFKVGRGSAQGGG